MQTRSIRSNKNAELLSFPNQELGRIERTNRKARKLAEMVDPVILMRDEAGVLRDEDGHVCNAQGQRLDGNGNPIAPAAIVNEEVAPVVARERTLADYNRPDEFYRNMSAIRLPTFDRNDFELKPSYYQLVGQHPFHGLSHEHPMDHIERFEDLVTSIKANGVTNDFLFCKLFPYSLGGEAAYWLKQLPTDSLTSLESVKKAFLHNFYDDAKSDELRDRILQFVQGPTKAFKDAWVRYRAYQRDCPHHGFSKVQLLGTFFRGVDWRYQVALDSASNGNFNTRSPREAEALIDNLASSNSAKNADLERRKQPGSVDGKQISALQNKIDSVHNILVNKKSVQFAAEVETFEPEDERVEEDVNYVGGTGFQNQRYENNQNRSGYNNFGQRSNFSGNQNSTGYVSKPQYSKPFTSNNSSGWTYGSSSYQAPPAQTETSEMKAMLEQILEGQQKITVDFNGKIDALYTDLNSKVEALSTHVKKLDIQVAQTA
ncbi:hypothetical protein V5N11_003129 [Cardamine amara subsp. amara]|uniref:Retrotransposon gag domain-containing protein n=1 Tax=Cardamine amara subsp. amara TaxID=228776 RepID=A0ABD0ZCN8_CARAN